MNPDKPALLIFDEIQLLGDPANLLKLLHDHFPRLGIIATGSSSLKIKHKFSDSLSGRKRIFQVEPLNFDEFLVFKGEDQLIQIRSFYTEGENEALIPLVKTYHSYFLNLIDETDDFVYVPAYLF
ncbi:MAG: AAA family ATPase [Thermodesulfobacteriota bacterium]|nr:AAA family ATPase [Thermodesulfobacteriota bacterium]